MATTASEAHTSESTEGKPARKTPPERKEALGRAVQRQVSLGARVESQPDYQAILSTAHRFNHLLRFVTWVAGTRSTGSRSAWTSRGTRPLHELSQ